MTTISRRIAAAAALLAAPALIALGTATAHAESTVRTNGPAISHAEEHNAFPHQTHTPKPGTPDHHHHQKNHAK